MVDRERVKQVVIEAINEADAEDANVSAAFGRR